VEATPLARSGRIRRPAASPVAGARPIMPEPTCTRCAHARPRGPRPRSPPRSGRARGLLASHCARQQQRVQHDRRQKPRRGATPRCQHAPRRAPHHEPHHGAPCERDDPAPAIGAVTAADTARSRKPEASCRGCVACVHCAVCAPRVRRRACTAHAPSITRGAHKCGCHRRRIEPRRVRERRRACAVRPTRHRPRYHRSLRRLPLVDPCLRVANWPGVACSLTASFPGCYGGPRVKVNHGRY
jgi:hypothetical protein